MNRIAATLIMILIATGVSAPPKAENSPRMTAAPLADYCFQRYSDTISNLWLAHSNRMAVGRRFGSPSLIPMIRSRSTACLPVSASFPGGPERSIFMAPPFGSAGSRAGHDGFARFRF